MCDHSGCGYGECVCVHHYQNVLCNYSEILISPEVPLSLCLSSRLMLGIVRIHQRQAHFTLSKCLLEVVYCIIIFALITVDSEYLKRRFEVFSCISFDHCQARLVSSHATDPRLCVSDLSFLIDLTKLPFLSLILIPAFHRLVTYTPPSYSLPLL